jgi:hypothetical protein
MGELDHTAVAPDFGNFIDAQLLLFDFQFEERMPQPENL